MSMNVEGCLRWQKDLSRLFYDDDGRELSHKEAKAFLKQCRAEGKRVIPMSGVECPGWSHEKGCPGHPVERYRLRASTDEPGTWAVDKYVARNMTQFTGTRIPML